VKDLRTRYAITPDGVYVAYQTSGGGPIDVVWQPDWPGNVDLEWDLPALRALLTSLESFSRLIRHDHRGVGLSSRNVPVPTLETRVADLLLVLEEVGAPRPTLVGTGASGAVNALLAATAPDRVANLVWMDGEARYLRTPDYPWGRTEEDLEAELVDLRSWGTEEYGRVFAASQASIGNPMPEPDAEALSRVSRNACTPDVAIELSRMWAETDVRDVLPTIQVPTLVLCLDGPEADRSRDIADRIPGADFVVLPEETFTRSSMELAANEVRRFVGASRSPAEFDSVLATVLFTDIVGSTERQATLGDRAWADLVEEHHARVRESLARWHGTEQDTAGDGFYATFDGPVRAIRCAHEIVDRVRAVGLEVRAGVHTGECRWVDGKIGGLAVATGARVAATAGPSEVRVSQTVRDLVAGSGLSFLDAGEHELKGVPGRWRLYVVPD